MNYEDLISRYLQNETTAAEHEALLQWIKSDSNNKAQFEAVVRAWQLSGQRTKRFDSAKAYKALQQKTSAKEIALTPKRSGFTMLKRAMQVAAVVAIAVGGYLYLRPQQDVRQTTIANASNDVRLVTLPDGSKAYLNAGAQISFPEQFALETRQIHLSGEAFFEVTHNAAKPFIVSTNQASVRVLGTSFSVIDDTVSHETQVIVETGKVRLQGEKETAFVDLVPGESGTFAVVSKQLTKVQNTDPNYASWHTGHLTFKNTNLQTVVSTLQRHYKANIALTDSSAANCKFTARFDHEPIENVFKMLELTFSFKITQTNNGYVIAGKGC